MDFPNGTSFHFVDAPPREVLRLAQEAANGGDVRIGGGPSIRETKCSAAAMRQTTTSQVKRPTWVVEGKNPQPLLLKSRCVLDCGIAAIEQVSWEPPRTGDDDRQAVLSRGPQRLERILQRAVTDGDQHRPGAAPRTVRQCDADGRGNGPSQATGRWRRCSFGDAGDQLHPSGVCGTPRSARATRRAAILEQEHVRGPPRPHSFDVGSDSVAVLRPSSRGSCRLGRCPRNSPGRSRPGSSCGA